MKFFGTVAVAVLGAIAVAVPISQDKYPPNLVAVQVSTYAWPASRPAMSDDFLDIEFWKDINKGGEHWGGRIQAYRCYNLVNGWNDSFSSMEVHSKIHACQIYSEPNCDNDEYNKLWFFVRDYWSNLDEGPESYAGMNDKMSSFVCGDHF